MLEKTLMQRRAGDHVIGRISSAYSAVVMAATLAGALLASLAAAWIGRDAALNLAIAVIAAAAVPATRLPPRVAAERRAQPQVSGPVSHAAGGASTPSAETADRTEAAS
jgi:hypothetical protein